MPAGHTVGNLGGLPFIIASIATPPGCVLAPFVICILAGMAVRRVLRIE